MYTDGLLFHFQEIHLDLYVSHFYETRGYQSQIHMIGLQNFLLNLRTEINV